MVFMESRNIEQVFLSESSAEFGQALENFLHLSLIGRSINGDELAANFYFLEFS
jgi:hypothetical protein